MEALKKWTKNHYKFTPGFDKDDCLGSYKKLRAQYDALVAKVMTYEPELDDEAVKEILTETHREARQTLQNVKAVHQPTPKKFARPTKKSKTKPVIAYIGDEEIGRWNSIKDAAAGTGCSASRISDAVNYGMPCCGIAFREWK